MQQKVRTFFRGTHVLSSSSWKYMLLRGRWTAVRLVQRTIMPLRVDLPLQAAYILASVADPAILVHQQPDSSQGCEDAQRSLR